MSAEVIIDWVVLSVPRGSEVPIPRLPLATRVQTNSYARPHEKSPRLVKKRAISHVVVAFSSLQHRAPRSLPERTPAAARSFAREDAIDSPKKMPPVDVEDAAHRRCHHPSASRGSTASRRWQYTRRHPSRPPVMASRRSTATKVW